jgi:integrase
MTDTLQRTAVSANRGLPVPITVAEAAEVWLARGRGQTGPWARSTRERYERIVRQCLDRAPEPGVPAIGGVRLAELTVDTVADWSAANERVMARTSASIALLTLRQVLRFAVRRGWMPLNPATLLEPAEKPRWRPQHVDILEGDDLARVLDHAHSYRALFTFLAFTGLRIGEALGLTWRDVDTDAGLVRVHRQLTRYREHGRLKTEAGRREVILAAPVLRLLREVWLGSGRKGADDFVFVNADGRPHDYRKVGRAFRVAVDQAGVRGAGRLSLHSLRHGYASLLIGSGLDVVFVSRQLGHAKADVTLRVYAHLFARREHADRAKVALAAGYAAVAAAGRG